MIDLRQGNVLDVLQTLPDESVNCIITSPPYWGLRAYGTEPQIWLNGHVPCAEHQWSSYTQTKKRPDLPPEPNNGQRTKAENLDEEGRGKREDIVMKSDTCSVCGAWRGELGLEPTVALYIEHLVTIFKEAMRVLRKDGTCWVNLGDSYNSGNSGHGEWTGEKARQGDGEQKKKGMTRKHTDELAPKNLLGVPWRFAFAMQDAGFILRQDIIWQKPNPMPESVRDRCTKAHEYVFLLSKSSKYYFDSDAILEPANYDGRKDTKMKGAKKYPNGFVPPDANANTMRVQGHERWSRKLQGTEYGGDGSALRGHSGNLDAEGNPLNRTGADGIPARNKRSVWTVTTTPYRDAHFATFPPKLIEPMVLAGCPVGGTVLDPFNGAGTTGLVALKHGRNYIGIELKPEYIEMTRKRFDELQTALPLK